MKSKEAVGNLGEEETAFLYRVRMTRDDTRRDADALFTIAHQSRSRDRGLMEKLFVQAPAAMTMAHNLLKEASEDQFAQFEKIKTAYNVYHYFESGAHLTPAQRRYPELQKVARLMVTPKKSPKAEAKTGNTSDSTILSGSNV